MFVVCLLVIVGIFVIPSLKSANYNTQWNKKQPQEKWNYYLNELRKYGWDTFDFGKTAARSWNYNQTLDALEKLEQGIFPITDYKIDSTGKIDGEQITLGLDEVEDYINSRNEYERRFGKVKHYATRIERFFDEEIREQFRNGNVIIDGKQMTFAEAKAYCYDKVTAAMEKYFGFKMEE